MAAGARGKGRPKRTETVVIDRAIHTAALDALLEHGEAATMHAVAQRAGLSRKSLYARYPNKAALFLGSIRELLASGEALQFDTDGTAEERLGRYIEAALATIARPESQALQHLLRRDHGYFAALKTEMLDATRTIFFEPLAALLREAKARDELAIDDVEATARAVIQLIFAEGLRPEEEGSRARPRAPQADYAAFLTRLLTRGLTVRGG